MVWKEDKQNFWIMHHTYKIEGKSLKFLSYEWGYE